VPTGLWWQCRGYAAGSFEQQFLDDWDGTQAGRLALQPQRNERRHQWVRDLDRIFANVHVVTNNGSDSIGGGGTPRQPLAPPFA
jgi:hypothetical protein